MTATTANNNENENLDDLLQISSLLETPETVKLKKEVTQSREQTRVQCKELHDLDLRMRQNESVLVHKVHFFKVNNNKFNWLFAYKEAEIKNKDEKIINLQKDNYLLRSKIRELESYLSTLPKKEELEVAKIVLGDANAQHERLVLLSQNNDLKKKLNI